MRIPLMFLGTVIALMTLADWRIWYVVRHRFGKSAARVHLLLAAIVWAVLIVAVCLPRRSGSEETLLTIMWMLYGVATIVIPKILFVVIDFIACIPQFWKGRRWRPMTWIASALSALTFILMWWGALVNRFNIDVREVEIPIENLPKAFDGYRIVQFSDMHVGTFGTDTAFVSDIVERINGLGADAVVFTGDIVNRYSEEIDPFISPLSRLHAPDGVYSILGNHDYGDYYNWSSAEAKRRSFEHLLEAEQQMGWRLLLDSHEFIRRGGDSIAIVGVQNIGDPPFPSYGSLGEAMKGIGPKDVRILLSHNPAHWGDAIAPDNSLPVDLTLAGHTHAMQIELFGLSPAAWRYKLWGGLYNDDDSDRKLYVNIGAGTVGMPMRIGATPELTLFTLRRKK